MRSQISMVMIKSFIQYFFNLFSSLYIFGCVHITLKCVSKQNTSSVLPIAYVLTKDPQMFSTKFLEIATIHSIYLHWECLQNSSKVDKREVNLVPLGEKII